MSHFSKNELFTQWKQIILKKKSKNQCLLQALNHNDTRLFKKTIKGFQPNGKISFPSKKSIINDKTIEYREKSIYSSTKYLSNSKKTQNFNICFDYQIKKSFKTKEKIFIRWKLYIKALYRYYEKKYKALSFLKKNLLIKSFKALKVTYIYKENLFKIRNFFIDSFETNHIKKIFFTWKEIIQNKINKSYKCFSFKWNHVEFNKKKRFFIKMKDYTLMKKFFSQKIRFFKNKMLFKKFKLAISIEKSFNSNLQQNLYFKKDKILAKTFKNLLVKSKKNLISRLQMKLSILNNKETLYKAFFKFILLQIKRKKMHLRTFIKIARKKQIFYLMDWKKKSFNLIKSKLKLKLNTKT